MHTKLRTPSAAIVTGALSLIRALYHICEIINVNQILKTVGQSDLWSGIVTLSHVTMYEPFSRSSV